MLGPQGSWEEVLCPGWKDAGLQEQEGRYERFRR